MTEWDEIHKPPVADSKAAIDFLQKYSPDNPVVLTAISMGKSPRIYGIVLQPKEYQVGGRVFIQKHNGTSNIYFSVNPIKSGLDIKKAKKNHLASLTHLHIDLDPEGTKPLVDERKRILDKLMSFNPPPTIVIDSGGGFQGFWRLETPVPVKSVVEVEELERYNIQLSVLLGGDACHNLDRIMRLPGTINIPTPVKVKKGRVEALARVVHFNEEIVYDIGKFTKATTTGPVTKEKKKPIIADAMKGDITIDSASLDVLPISERMRELIIHGKDPEEEDRWASRSECLFHVVCGLVREGQSNEIIYSLITNPEFKISESVLDAANSQQYAEKQIGRAREDVTKREDATLSKLHPDHRSVLAKMDKRTRMLLLHMPSEKLEAMLELNGKHCVIKEAGKVRILNEEYDTILQRNSLTRSTFDDLKNFYSNRFIETENAKGEEVVIRLGKWWLDQALRRQYEKILFNPQPPGVVIDEQPGVYNLFRGYSVEPSEEGDWSLFRQHILENICSDNTEHFDYLIGWMANAVQNPARPGQVAIVLKGEKGTGKSKFAKIFGNLFGQHFLHIGNPKHLTGNFNQHLRDSIVIFADEAIWAGDKQGESVLKMLVTEETLIIEGKGIDPICCPNFVHLIMASNHDWVVPAGNQERRYFLPTVSNGKAQDGKFFAALTDQMNNGGNAALLYYLWKLDISEYDLRKIPETDALEVQQALSLSPYQSWWEHKLRDGRLLYKHNSWHNDVPKKEFYDDYILDMQNQGVAHRLSNIAFANFLKTMLASSDKFTKDKQIKTTGGERPYVFSFPSLEECRGLYEKYTKRVHTWPEIVAAKKVDQKDDNKEVESMF